MEKIMRSACRSQLTKIVNAANELTISDNFNVREATVLVARLKATRDNLNNANEKIAETIASDQLEVECEKILEYEDSAVTAIALLEQRMAEIKEAAALQITAEVTSNIDGERRQPVVENHNTNQPKMSVRLPKIELIKFSGDHHEWPAFWEQFNQAVHSNNSLDETDKFTYLKTVLTGNAATTIQGLTSSKISYNDAIELLTEEYGNKERIVDIYIQQLLSLTQVKSKSDIMSLRKLYNTTSKITRSLQTLGIPPSSYGMMVKSIILKALPLPMRIEFNKQQAIGDQETENDAQSNARSSNSRVSTITYETQMTRLLSYIKLEVDSVEQVRFLTDEKTIEKPNFAKNRERVKFNGKRDFHRDNSYTAAGLFTTVNEQCVFCKSKEHFSANCNGTLNINEKKNILKADGRCYRCTKRNHNSRMCKTMISCLKCKRKHATSMCDPDYAKIKGGSGDNANGQSSSTNLLANGRLDNIYLQTACARIAKDNQTDSNENETFVRLVLDGGSQLTFIKECVSRQLNLPVIGTHKISIMGFGKSEAAPARVCKRVLLTLKALDKSSEIIKISAVEVPEICFDSLTPPSENDPLIYDFSKRHRLADMYPKNINVLPGISILIGADNYWKIVANEVQKLSDSLTAVSTKLGWTIHGGSNGYCYSANIVNTLHVQVEQNNDDKIDIRKFWDLETIGIKRPDIEIGTNTIDFVNRKITLQNDRYTVALPWINESVKLDSNYNGALYRVKSLTKRLIRNNKLVEYDNAMNEYFQNDCAELVPEAGTDKRTYYMPHRPVYRDDKDTTRVRCVFDASAHMPGFPSLNDLLSPGENLVPLLLTVLLNFRIGKVALVADIEKAFLQIELAENDRNSHRFLWYAEPIKEVSHLPDLVEYRMKRVTFGVTCSPFLLAATLKKHLTSQPQELQEIAEILLESFYVDDLIVAVDCIENAKQIYNQGRQILSKASMNLRKWSTNNVVIRKTIEEESLPMDTKVKKVLGLLWFTQTDEFSIDIKAILDKMEKPQGLATKRKVLKTVSQIYDPLGLVSPYTVTAKMLLQEMWKNKLDWDTILPENLANEWTKWLNDLPQISNFILPSPRAYGAVAYLKSINEENVVSCNIMIAKNRVAPITNAGDKTLTLPRLELTGALCAARLQHFILNNLKITVNSSILWTDSKIALHWINGRANKWKPYICHRVTEIQYLSVGEWRHCPGSENPADLLTRGVKAKVLVDSEFWRYGPTWLQKNSSEWPQNDVEVATDQVLVYAVCSSAEETNQETIFPIKNFSNLEKILRITSYVLRFVKNLKNPKDRVTERNATVKEIQESEKYWIKVTQQQNFNEELASLKKNGKVEVSSNILTLNPFLDDTGILRLGGRLQESLLSYETKHPIILPKKSTLTDRLIWTSHILTNHGGVNATLTYLRQKYWIIHARQRIKTVLHICLKCRKLRGKGANEHFAPLPSSRLQAVSPFKVTGVDFAGPLFINTENGKTKAYIMLFTCAVIRAIHLELVPNLNTESCIRALRRFISRRGVPEIIYSDNAKTFKRTSVELKELVRILCHDEFQEVVVQKHIEWRFIVERAAWWGGFWERLIKTVKDALKLTLGKRVANYDELHTTLAEVEATVNMRPLTYIHNDPDDLLILTPSHFLLGSSNCGFTIDYKNPDIKRDQVLKQWKIRNEFVQKFWKRWSTDYIQQLRSAHNNNNVKSTCFKVGDIVLVHDQNMPRLSWKMARITQVFHGRDGKIRACEVITPNRTVLRRPIQLLHPLELTAAGEDVENCNPGNAVPTNQKYLTKA